MMILRVMSQTAGILLSSAALSSLSAQAVIASSCFELNPLADSLTIMPDSVQVLAQAPGPGGGLSRVPIYQRSIATGRFVAGGLIVTLELRRRDQTYVMFFRPEGDRMVGWFIDEETDHPDLGDPWEIEAHRFSCRPRRVP